MIKFKDPSLISCAFLSAATSLTQLETSIRLVNSVRPRLSIPPQILPLKYSPSSLSSMSRRPGPKPNFDISYLGGVASVNAKQFEVVEQLLPFIVGTNPDENTTQLLQELRRLNQEAADLKEGHGFFFCEICEKSFCDAKGVRRHILATFDEQHRELKREVTSLTCRYCDRTFKKRESVSKHQNACPNNGESWAFPFRFGEKVPDLWGTRTAGGSASPAD